MHNFWRKIFLLLYFINWQNLIVWSSLLCGILGNICIVIVCKPGCYVINFEVNLILLIKPFFVCDQKVVTKTVMWQFTSCELRVTSWKFFMRVASYFLRAGNKNYKLPIYFTSCELLLTNYELLFTSYELPFTSWK